MLKNLTDLWDYMQDITSEANTGHSRPKDEEGIQCPHCGYLVLESAVCDECLQRLRGSNNA